MFEYRKALKASIERNEFGQLLRGEGAYFYEDKLSRGPVDYASALRSIYELYKSDNSIKSLLQDELMKMISEGNEKVIMALTYLMFHLSYVDDGDNSFDIDVQNILNYAKEVVNIEAFSDEEKNVVYKINKMMQSYKYSQLSIKDLCNIGTLKEVTSKLNDGPIHYKKYISSYTNVMSNMNKGLDEDELEKATNTLEER